MSPTIQLHAITHPGDTAKKGEPAQTKRETHSTTTPSSIYSQSVCPLIGNAALHSSCVELAAAVAEQPMQSRKAAHAITQARNLSSRQKPSNVKDLFQISSAPSPTPIPRGKHIAQPPYPLFTVNQSAPSLATLLCTLLVWSSRWSSRAANAITQGTTCNHAIQKLVL